MAELETVKQLTREQLEQAAALSGIPTEGVSDEDLQTSVSNQATPDQIAAIITAEPPVDPAGDEPTDPTAGTNNEADTLNNPDGDDIEADPTDPVAAQAATADDSGAADFKGTKVVHARLVKSYDHPRGHRRAGFQFAIGPVPQRLEVTAEQLNALKGDAAIEIVSASEAKRVTSLATFTPLQEGSTPEQQDPALVAGEADTRGSTTGRNRRYASDPTHSDSPEFDATSEALGNTVTEPAATDSDLPQVSTDLKAAELAAIASAENVEGADAFGKPGVKKQVIVDAILANRTKE
jgi:hypothetical protein